MSRLTMQAISTTLFRLLLLVSFSILLFFGSANNSYAASTPSNSEREDLDHDGDRTFEWLLSLLQSAFDDNGNLDSASLFSYVSDNFTPDDILEGEIIPCEGDFETEDTETPFANLKPVYSNMLRYHVRINGSNFLLLLSPDDLNKLWIDNNKYLWNVSTSNISGRLIPESQELDPSATTGVLVTLGPCLGNTFSANRNYGSPNYRRTYYWSGSNLNYSTEYIKIQVTDFSYPFRVSDTIPWIVVILIGGCVLCLWRRSARF